MAGNPITWRNVAGPALGDASSSLSDAATLIDSAFNKFGNVHTNWVDQRTEKDTNAYLDALRAQFRTPEALNAAIQSGALQEMQQQQGAFLDPTKAREAPDQLLQTLLDRTQKVQGHEDTQALRGARGQINDLYRDVAQTGTINTDALGPLPDVVNLGDVLGGLQGFQKDTASLLNTQANTLATEARTAGQNITNTSGQLDLNAKIQSNELRKQIDKYQGILQPVLLQASDMRQKGELSQGAETRLMQDAIATMSRDGLTPEQIGEVVNGVVQTQGLSSAYYGQDATDAAIEKEKLALQDRINQSTNPLIRSMTDERSSPEQVRDALAPYIPTEDNEYDYRYALNEMAKYVNTPMEVTVDGETATLTVTPQDLEATVQRSLDSRGFMDGFEVTNFLSNLKKTMANPKRIEQEDYAKKYFRGEFVRAGP